MAWRTRLLGGLIAVCSILVLLLALELLARALPATPEPPRRAPYVNADPALRELTNWFELGTPFQRGLRAGVLYETNALGLRSPDIPRAKPPGEFRVALLGDSFVMGEGVLVEDSYAGILRRELPSVKPGRYEIVNTGLAGLNAIRAVGRYQKTGLPYDPDLAIYGFTLNDIEGPSYRKSYAFSIDPYGVKQSRSALWRLIGPGYVAMREAFWPAKGTYAYELRDNYFANDAAWQKLSQDLDTLRAIDEHRGICTVMLLHTQLVTLNAVHPFRAIYKRVGDLAREKGFFVVDSLPAHSGAWDRELWVSPADSHPNEKGHRILADTLLAGLKALPDRCWTRPGRT